MTTIHDLLNSELFHEAAEEAEKLNEDLKEVYNELNEVTQLTNLKLHDVAAEADHYSFEVFCEYQFDVFQDVIDEKAVELKRPVGSSFYIVSSHTLSFFDTLKSGLYTNDFDTFVSVLAGYVDLPGYTEYESVKDYIEADYEHYNDIENTELELEQILKDIDLYYRSWHDDVKEALENVKAVYKYIEDFKANQVEIYREDVADLYLNN